MISIYEKFIPKIADPFNPRDTLFSNLDKSTTVNSTYPLPESNKAK